MSESISLYQLNRLMGNVILSTPGTQNVWVTAELSDVSTKGGHVYMELIEKDDRGSAIAKARAMIWQSTAYKILPKFETITGQRFVSGIKVMVKASASLHPLYGLSLNITDINPEFTMGDLLRRRNEILARLKNEGILDANKSLPWNVPSLRIAIISASTAAGYGDFSHHLATAGLRFRFTTRLFPAAMQGEKTVDSVLSAFDSIENHIEKWDVVVIIRGGGATSDLASFESYELAARIACFPIPVIVGIGHERDITVLDYVAKVRVKTPTAAADLLIQEVTAHLEDLREKITIMTDLVRERIKGDHLQLSHYSSSIPLIAENTLRKVSNNLQKMILFLESAATKRLLPANNHILNLAQQLKIYSENVLSRSKEYLSAKSAMLEVLSPQSTLKRGYSITTANGRTLKSVNQRLEPGTTITTILHDGKLESILQ